MFRDGVRAALALCLLAVMQTAVAQVNNANDAAPAAASVPEDYRMGPGDTLQVFVWRNPDLSVTVPVRPDGKISTPLVSDMVVVGKTPSQLARDIEKVLAEYIRDPRVNVIVTQPVSAFSQVKVVGQVAKPQAVAYHDGMTLMDLMLQVGVLGEFAAGNRARLVRSEGGKSVEMHLRLADLMKKGDMKQNVLLKPGDVVIVPESFF
jgi:polysaccharide export outer membrane protein